jgi:eukaryotic-like serine/threonine-protein kinase
MISEAAAQPALETILRAGQTVAAKYRVDRLIAAGGMAAVWAGTNLRTGKRVALKVILRSFASTPGAEELFRREAFAASRVNHPNVVTVFDVVDHAARTCIVMEYLDGEDLGTYFERQGILGLEEAVALLLPAMKGVAAANAQGVVHRDLKPKNIFLCIGPDRRLVTTKILDFGISVMVERATEPRSKTVELTTHGTPSYMSPEHIIGSPDIDERADVYGFGVILFEALAGQAPYIGPAGPELLTRILEEPVPKITRFRPDLSPQVQAIIERAIAKNPDDRFPTLGHFIEALEDHVLPPSPMLRSLSPAIGVPIVDSGSGPRGLADPVMRVVRREPSGEYAGVVTKALSSLSRTVPPRKDEQPSQAIATEDPPVESLRSRTSTSPRMARIPPSPDDTISLVRRRTRAWGLLAVAAVVGAVAVAVAWFVVPDPAPTVGTSKPSASAASLAPGHAPLPARPTLSEPVLPSTPSIVGGSPQAVLPRRDPPSVPEALPRAADEGSIDDASAHAYPETRNRTTRASPRSTTRGLSSVKTPTSFVAPEMPPSTVPSARPAEPPPIAPPSVVASPPAERPTRAGRLSTDDF